MNSEFQSMAKKDKKAFLNEQCKEVEENNKMGKTRDLFPHSSVGKESAFNTRDPDLIPGS